jgi:hypothetical protein
MFVSVYTVDSVIVPSADNVGPITVINYASVPIYLAFDTAAVLNVGLYIAPNGASLVLTGAGDLHAIHSGHGPVDVSVIVGVSASGGGSTTLAALTDVDLNNIQDGDVVTWDAASGKFVNAAASGGGGVPDEFKIGAAIELSAIDLVTNTYTTLSLDDTQPGATLNFLHGLTLNEDQDGYVIGTKGRYAVAGWMAFGADLSTSFQVTAGISPTTNSNCTTVTSYLQVLSAAVIPSQSGQSLSYWQLIELDVGDIVQFWVSSGLDTTLHDSLLSIQYIGPAVSL